MELPPLLAVRFFEASARHLSVTLAAQELHVSPGAVSQQIAKLEQSLGCVLLQRRGRGLCLTEAGHDYYQSCQQALALLHQATRQLRTAKQQIVRVSCTAGFATQWLIPRLSQFMQRHAGIDVHVNTTHRLIDLQREQIDFAIRHGLGDYPGLVSIKLLDDELVPVCSPTLLPERAGFTVDAIPSQQLLHDESRDDWRLWAQAQGYPDLDSNQGIVFFDTNGVIEAARAGLGYALLRPALIQAELQLGQLMVLSQQSLASGFAYYLVFQPDALVLRANQRFQEWLLQQFQA